MKWKNLFPINKIPYLKNKKNINHCILCEIIKGSCIEKDLTIYKNALISIMLNLYPYNPGHIMILPNRHIEDIRELNDNEEKNITYYTKKIMDLLEKEYNSQSFNIGYNIGKFSGASISHLHLHIVPRYPNELGFIDIISGSKLIVEDPTLTRDKLREVIKKYI
ncbi:MAG TPA: HIT domain-containing protein [Spirochaetota bacterium]|nr:HIT domain-containing protein [Spirochaetota bacterium]HOM38892.1 HIT domain-containing protein [Spirochaetota bacterium]HPQ49129.1 HIT domain-containing protein [Spirochaetota bacterium]